MRRILILPPHDLGGAWTDPPDPARPDRGKTFRLMAARGYSWARIDPFGRPWNPLAKAPPMLRAIDPLRALAVLLFHRRTDVVLCFYESAALVILLLRRVFFFRAKVAIYDTGIVGGSRLRDLILRLAMPRADLLLPLGHSQVAGLVALGASPARILPVHDIACIDFYADQGDRPEGYVLAVGDDVSRDYPTFLAATDGLARPVIIRSRLLGAQTAPRAGLTIVPTPLSPVQYRDLIAGAAIVVVPLAPSIHAGGISILLEAMACGKAVISSASPGLADYLRDGTNCLVVPPGDPAALRAAIERLLADGETRRRLGREARRFMVENCSAEQDAIQFADALDRLLRS